MNSFALFTDVSVNPHCKLGVGGYLLVPVSFLEIKPLDIVRDEVSTLLISKRFEETSSTKLEIQTVLWALEEIREEFTDTALNNLHIYTDSQCVAGLMGRRSRLENNNFISKRSERELSNALLYRAFYAAHDQLGFQLIKVPGHTRADSHDSVQRIFSYVDREVRKVLSIWMNSLESPHSHSQTAL